MEIFLIRIFLCGGEYTVSAAKFKVFAEHPPPYVIFALDIRKENKMGCRASDTAEIVMQDCRVPDANRLGGEGQGFVDALRILDGGRIGIGALGVGIAQGA